MTLKTFPPFYQFVITDKDDLLSSDAILYFDQQFQCLKDVNILIDHVVLSEVSENDVTINGLVPPTKTTAQITQLTSDVNNPVPLGTMWYNSGTKKLNYLKEYTSPGVAVISEIQSAP